LGNYYIYTYILDGGDYEINNYNFILFKFIILWSKK
jgi:hypothetical protein